LGDRRANAVRDFLVSLGIDGTRLQTISYGEERPFCSQDNDDCWQQNRRGHFVLLPSEAPPAEEPMAEEPPMDEPPAEEPPAGQE
jgi:hypothetical protein